MYDPDHHRQQPPQQPRKKSKLGLLLLASRVATLASLLVSIVILRSNKKTYDGCVYSLLQIPFALYFFLRGELLIRYTGFVKFEFYADKVTVVLLATAVGATFGATTDMDDHVRNDSEWEHTLHDFWRLMYLPASFLLVGFATSIISAIFSSEIILARVTTLVSLAISIVILKNSTKTYPGKVTFYGDTYDNGYRIRYSDYSSYKMRVQSAANSSGTLLLPQTQPSHKPHRYTFYVMIIGFVYNLLQIPLAIYFFFRGELLIRYSRFVKFQFYADKVMVVLLAAAVGATFGATSDLDKHVKNESELEHRLHDYWSLMYLPASILLVGFITSLISAVISSETTLAKSQHS
nr:CASP-like protein 4D1 [Ipomoea batatas]